MPAAAHPATRRQARTTSSSSAAGFPLHSPFGTFYAPNISSDPKAGIGGWTEHQFVNAMLKGTTPERFALFPGVSRITSYRMMPVGDVRDLFAYMKTLPAVSGCLEGS